MRISSLLTVVLTFIGAAGLCLLAASFLATGVEDSTEIGVRAALDEAEHEWAEVQANGLQVIMSGTAPDEASRFAALSVVDQVVDAARIIDGMEVAPSRELAPPRFSAQILRNQSGISLIGLVPVSTDRDRLVQDLQAIVSPAPVSDLFDVADYPVPDGWKDALGFTVAALEKLPRTKISVDAGHVSIEAIADSPEAKAELERDLKQTAPPGLRLMLDISAPRPVITPFTLRYVMDAEGGRFDACSADTEETRAMILKAAGEIGSGASEDCRLGLGVPSPAWGQAVSVALGGLGALGQGSVTFADADITLIAAEGTAPNLFDRVVGELEADLPDVFALHAVLPVPAGEEADQGPPEFTATLSPEGLVQLRGRLNDEEARKMADSYAKARFGSASVYTAARTADGLPPDWPVRVLTGIEALSRLTNGVVTVTPDNVDLRGVTQREDAKADIAGLLSDRLGGAEAYQLDITYRAPPPPVEEVMTPEVCEAEIAKAQSTYGKISFEPGSDTIAAESQVTMEEIAEILRECGEIKLEIQGHTDSQGRTSMNQELSQSRAQSVLNELRARRILTSTYIAKGYGESEPIADNKTADGREANRRIEFRLILPPPIEETETTLEAVAGQETPARDAEGEESTEASDSEQN
ncbi:MAG: OmpA family protein [Arenibacterium sp.]